MCTRPALNATHTPSLRDCASWFALYVLALLAVYGRAAGYPFLQDDIFHFVDNSTVHGWDGLATVWTTNYWEGEESGGLYRPILKSLWVLEVAGLGGSRAAVLGVSLLLHAVNAVWIAALARRSGIARPIAAGAGLWFALHAAHTEVVVNGVGQGESLSLLFLLAALSVLQPGRSGRPAARIALLALLALAAMLTKEHGFAVVAVSAVALWCSAGLSLRAKLVASAALLAVVTFSVALRILVVGSFGPQISAQVLGDRPLGERILSAPYVLGRYALLALAPVRLSADYDWLALELPPGVGDPRLLLGLICLLAATGLAIGCLARRRASARAGLVALAAAVVPLAPFLGVVAIGTLFAERHAYLALAGIAWLFAWLAQAVARRWSSRGVASVLVVWAIALGVRAAVRVPVWSERILLWETTVRDCPKSFIGASHAAWLHMDARDNVEARRYAEYALLLAPRWPAAHIVLGNVDLMEGAFANARAHFLVARDDPDFEIGARVGEACANLALGARDEARRAYEQLLREAPGDERVNRLGRLLQRH